MTTATILTDAQIADLREIGESVTQAERDLTAGREPVVSTTPNGRNILLVRGGFSVQPRNDNYWITVPSIDAAMDAFENPAKYRD
jgi:hypothetical protein